MLSDRCDCRLLLGVESDMLSFDAVYMPATPTALAETIGKIIVQQ